MKKELNRIARKVNNAREWIWEYASTRDLPKTLEGAVQELDVALETLEELLDADDE